jgi:hypothetical protein
MNRREIIKGLTVAVALPALSVVACEPNGITLLDRLILSREDADTLAEWSCILNTWGWPKALPNPEPAEYIKGGRRGQIHRWINKRIGGKASSRKWNEVRMTDEEFEDWWAARGNTEAYLRHKERFPRPSDPDAIVRQNRREVAHLAEMHRRHGSNRTYEL